MKNNKKGPQFIRFFIPVISVLQKLGGSGTSSEVTEIVVELMKISSDELSIINKSGQLRVHNQVFWARFYLVKAGYIDASKRGIWILTNKGKKITASDLKPLDVFDKVYATFRAETRKTVSLPETAEAMDSLDYKEELLEILKSLPPAGFEHLCQRLLRESGFEEVVVTGRTGDGGIDGNGILQLNPLVSFNILFQCKRYKNSVSPAEIRDFRGALQGRADKGIFITTGTFTSEAKKEARRDGAAPIELVDGDKLVKMFENLELGLIQKKTFEIEKTFFDEYKS